MKTSLHFTPVHPSAPGRFLVHLLSIQAGERYLGAVFRSRGKGGRWANSHEPFATCRTRTAAAKGLR